jgi:hypothetical protein
MTVSCMIIDLEKQMVFRCNRFIYIRWFKLLRSIFWVFRLLISYSSAFKMRALNKALRERAVAVELMDKKPVVESFRENTDYRLLKISQP